MDHGYFFLATQTLGQIYHTGDKYCFHMVSIIINYKYKPLLSGLSPNSP